MPGLAELFNGATTIISNDDRTTPLVQMSSNFAEDGVLLAEYLQLRTVVFRDYLATMAEDEKYYQQEFATDLIPPEWRARGFEPTVPPTAYNAVEAATNHILTTPDILIPERPVDTDALQEQALAAEKATGLMYFWHQVFKQGDPFGHAKKDIIKWGKVVLKKVIDPDALAPDNTFVGRKRFPWKVYQLAPQTVFEVGDPADPDCIYEAYLTKVATAKILYPEASGTWTNKKQQEDVRVVEYWEKPSGNNKGVRRIWIEGERVVNKVNPYYWVDYVDDKGKPVYTGYIPYFIADSGWGDGHLGAAPANRYVGMIRRIHSMLRTEARQLTAADAQLRISTFPIIKLKGIEEDDEHPIQLGPGAKVALNDEQDIAAMEWPQLDPGLFNIIKNVHAYTNELAQFQTLSGIPQSGVDSATEADQNFRSATAKLEAPIRGLKSIITRMNETVLMDIEHIFEAPVTLYGAADGMPGAVVLKPEDIDGFYENFVELKTSDQRALDAANAVRWANLYQTFGIDKRYAMKMAGIPNPQQRIAQRMQEDVWADPRSHEFRMAQYMQNQGEFGQQLAGIILDQMINGVVPNDQGEQPPAGPMVQPPQPQGPQSGMQMAGQGGGGFAPPPFGQPNARGQNPGDTLMAGVEQPPPQRNMARAVGFNRALMERPEAMFGGPA